MLDARAILHGQIWRIVTFLMWPLSGDLFLNVLVIYCYYNPDSYTHLQNAAVLSGLL